MKRALLVCAALLGAGACAQQDVALLVTISGQFLIPSGGDLLTLDVYDGVQSIKHLKWCATPAADCPALPAQTPLAASVTLVQSGAAHSHVKLNAELFFSNRRAGAGSISADFSAGRTEPVALTLTRP